MTYLGLNLVFLAIIVATTLKPAVRQAVYTPPTLIALAGLLILTAVFDNVIIGLGIVTYDPAKLLGLYIGRAPVEDFFYPVAAGLIVPALWKEGPRG